MGRRKDEHIPGYVRVSKSVVVPREVGVYAGAVVAIGLDVNWIDKAVIIRVHVHLDTARRGRARGDVQRGLKVGRMREG